MPSFRQRDQSDCGVTCLYYICHHYKLRTSVAWLRQLSGTDRAGTTALGIVETAEALGFSAKGVQCQAQDLRHVALPAIAHVRTPAGLFHYIVLCAAGGKRVTCMDPATGDRRKMSWDEFTVQWTGIVIILAPGLSYKPSKGRKRPIPRKVMIRAPSSGNPSKSWRLSRDSDASGRHWPARLEHRRASMPMGPTFCFGSLASVSPSP